jgi:predicted nucleic acid-binding protein
VDAVFADIQASATIIRQLDINLRAPDAINLAIARHAGASLVTFDLRMAENAVAMGVPVAAA